MIRLSILKKLTLTVILCALPLNTVLSQSTPSSSNLSPSSNDATLISPTTQIDYAPLRILLATQQWRQANEKTIELLLQATGRSKQGWIPPETLKKLSCWDLKTIDSLWREYSNNRFGFSTQFPLFIKTGNRPGRLIDDEAYQKFGDLVGWRKNSDWIVFKEDLNYTLNAPVGHLPTPRQQYQFAGGRLEYTTLAQTMISCGLVTYSPPKPVIKP
ncbi:hypothetical protein C7H19_12150 [Aphanothece hegewaldii CCALA 016]|uniref:GUN4-like domain-containing protein n=1 Tax=Aphanothece hegewaldii CCALA 016 TaxID=2107694 RepID=A0A2T1LXR2_9CHRO|nr:GUN4 domain-containing protein [Aphanothece hegewaldii]PSF37177.1 hypothetical protein C7H19_12150 [Aphanothece hegewaldii CCALA 016]